MSRVLHCCPIRPTNSHPKHLEINAPRNSIKITIISNVSGNSNNTICNNITIYNHKLVIMFWRIVSRVHNENVTHIARQPVKSHSPHLPVKTQAPRHHHHNAIDQRWATVHITAKRQARDKMYFREFKTSWTKPQFQRETIVHKGTMPQFSNNLQQIITQCTSSVSTDLLTK